MNGESDGTGLAGEPNWPLIDRYLAGRASLWERHTVERWLAQSTDGRTELSVLRGVLATPERAALHSKELSEDIKERTEAILRARPANRPFSIVRRLPAISGRAWRVAAGLGAVAAAALIATVVRMPEADVMSRPGHTYTTTAGERATIELNDGSRVMLAPQSRLMVARGFGITNRTLELSGEAHFTVVNRSESPFIVRTGAIVTRVLGTTFDIRRYPGEPVARVAVFSGRVTSGGLRTPVTLVAGTVGHFTDSTAMVFAAVDMDTSAAWTRGQLVFKATPIPTMLETVGRWYGYEFRVADSTLAAGDVSTVFNIRSTEETLAAIRELLECTMTFDGRVITLRPRPVSAKAPPRDRMRNHFSTRTEVGR